MALAEVWSRPEDPDSFADPPLALVEGALQALAERQEEHDRERAPADGDDYKVRSHTALVNQLTEVLQMTVRYEIEYFGAANAPFRLAAQKRAQIAQG